MPLKLDHCIFKLNLEFTFTIARGSSDFRNNVFCRLEADGVTGFGEAAPNPRYGETAQSCLAALDQMRDLIRAPHDDPEAFSHQIQAAVSGQYAAKAALDMALWDLTAKRAGLPLYQYWGLDARPSLETSITIGIDRPEVIHRKLARYSDFKYLKVKLGSADDRAMLAAIRQVDERPIRVDANEGWQDREQALEHIHWLAETGCELVEQPMPAAQHEDMAWLKDRSPLPLYADEAFLIAEDCPKLVQAYDGINIKLAKCGGLLQAKRAIEAAQVAGLKTMLGCMVESSLAIAAAAQLGSQVDVLDLDGNHLLSNDPFTGWVLADGALQRSGNPGLGASPCEPLFD